MSALRVVSPGMLSLLQDAGRFGMGHLGLTQGGPLDGYSFRWANALVQNPLNSTVIEHSIGGLILQATAPCIIAVTGAAMSLQLNGHTVPSWQPLALKPGDELELGIFSHGLRAYIAVAGGIKVPPHFGSSATVMREGIGGLAQNGQKLQAEDALPIGEPCNTTSAILASRLPKNVMQHSLTPLALHANPEQTKGTKKPKGSLMLRVIEGYQAQLFTPIERARFYLNPYTVTPQSDRMGYKLQGNAISCSTAQLLSEGISYGAIQIPPDGQPIVLLNDRQTLGGYPKLGTILSLDCWKLAQAVPGTLINFIRISPEAAHNALNLDAARFARELQKYIAAYSAAGANA